MVNKRKQALDKKTFKRGRIVWEEEFEVLNDRFEFNEKINLEKYLEKPEETPATYVLHSGDIHGGHYVVFIYTSSSFTLPVIGNHGSKRKVDQTDKSSKNNHEKLISSRNEGLSTKVSMNGELRSETTFQLTIENFSKLSETIFSDAHRVKGLPWKIMVMVTGSANDKDKSLGFFLQCNADCDTNWNCSATVDLRMLSFKKDVPPSSYNFEHVFCTKENACGILTFQSFVDVLDPEKGYIQNDTVILEAHVQVKAPLESSANRDSNSHAYRYVGLKNQGASCYMNSLLQTLYFTSEFRKIICKISTEADDSSKPVTRALQKVFYDLQFSNKPVETNISENFTLNRNEQHDVMEILDALLNQLEIELEGTPEEVSITRLFAGEMISYIKCKNLGYENKETEPFFNIKLNIKGKKNVIESFDDYVSTEILDGDNKYNAGEFGLHKAEKGVTFSSFPPILHLQLVRSLFDKTKNLFYKLNDRFEFNEKINLEKYLEKPEETPATYVLHAVLVHSGDIHGGHYVVFINPRGDDSWYKFGDDVVEAVPETVAIEQNYGGVEGAPNAYSLIYIRESKMKTILQEVTESDIPSELNDKLNEEKRMEKFEQADQITTAINDAIEHEIDFEPYSDDDLEELQEIKNKVRGILRLANEDCDECEFAEWQEEWAWNELYAWKKYLTLLTSERTICEEGHILCNQNSRTSYPKTKMLSKTVYAHQLVVYLKYGQELAWLARQDEGVFLSNLLEASHLCHRRTCINPACIVLETAATNTSRRCPGISSEGNKCFPQLHPGNPNCFEKFPSNAVLQDVIQIREFARSLRVTVTTPQSKQKDLQQSIQIMTKNRNFKCYALPSKKDEEQYSLVRVKEIEQLEHKPTAFWFQYYEYEQIIDNYKKTLNESYSSEDHAVIPFDKIVKFKNHLVMAKINGCWSRARIMRYFQNYDSVLEDIDTGYKTIATAGSVIKIPSKSELLKPAFAFKAVIVNLEDPSSVEITNLIKVRITFKNTFGPSEVEVKLANDENESVEPPVKEIDSPVSPVVTQFNNQIQSAEPRSNRIMIDQLQYKDITLGPEIKLIFCDGSQLDIGKIFVYEALPENSAFYDKLHEEIAAHVKNSSDDLYKPIVRELVLAKFDGFYYRASCVTVSDVEILVDFIDYGNLHTAKPEDIIKMPAHLFYPCCCKAVQLEFSSSRQYFELDVDRTRDLLLGKHEFLATVESNHLRQFTVTLDDSLVSFNPASDLSRTSTVQKKHKQPSSFCCPLCLKSFSKAFSLQLHMQGIHQGIKNFNCEKCDRSFIKKADLKRHLVTHTDSFDVTCTFEGCTRTFRTKNSMCKHLQRKHLQV